MSEQPDKFKLVETGKPRGDNITDITTAIRDGVDSVVQLPEGSDPAKMLSITGGKKAENRKLGVCSMQYSLLPDDIKERCSWEFAAARLLANDCEGLKKVRDMQGAGQLFGIDVEGKILFKDKGVEPVMYGYDVDDRIIKIYNREKALMDRVTEWADYYKIYELVYGEGYELFPSTADNSMSDEVAQAEAYTKEPFVASKDRTSARISWLESGWNPERARSAACFVPFSGRIEIASEFPNTRNDIYGVIRMLRV